MNYRAIYDAIMERARERVLAGYSERHHIIPRCLGGGNEDGNIAVLTPEEHYLAHQLLVKLYPGNGKLIWAAIAMTGTGRGNGRGSNKLYGWLKRKFSAEQTGRYYSQETKAKIGKKSRERNQGENHPMFGRSHSPEAIAKMSTARKGKKSKRVYGPISEETRKKLRAARNRTEDQKFLAREQKAVYELSTLQGSCP